MIHEKWRQIGAREKMQIVNGTALVFAAIVLYFLAFIASFTIEYPIVSAGATMLAAALAFFGITAFVKNQMTHFETNIDEKIRQFEREREEYRKEEPKKEILND